jgi:hypothetical protein
MPTATGGLENETKQIPALDTSHMKEDSSAHQLCYVLYSPETKKEPVRGALNMM